MGGKPRSQKTPLGCMIKHFKEGFVDGADYGFCFLLEDLKHFWCRVAGDGLFQFLINSGGLGHLHQKTGTP